MKLMYNYVAEHVPHSSLNYGELLRLALDAGSGCIFLSGRLRDLQHIAKLVVKIAKVCFVQCGVDCGRGLDLR